MQGDCMIAILFIYYLGCCLQKEKTLIAAPELLVTPKFADDIMYIAREKETIEKVEKDMKFLNRHDHHPLWKLL